MVTHHEVKQPGDTCERVPPPYPQRRKRPGELKRWKKGRGAREKMGGNPIGGGGIIWGSHLRCHSPPRVEESRGLGRGPPTRNWKDKIPTMGYMEKVEDLGGDKGEPPIT